MEEPVQHGQILRQGRMSDSSRHCLHTDQGKHSGVLRHLIGLSWIRLREEEALLMNNDLLVVKCSPLGGRPIVLW